jgi:Fe-S-cluster containining protein
VRDSLARRKGSCRGCGACCRFGRWRCPFLRKDNKCAIYAFRPTVLCRLPPLDLNPLQVQKHRSLNCGFCFEDEDVKK